MQSIIVLRNKKISKLLKIKQECKLNNLMYLIYILEEVSAFLAKNSEL